MKKNKIILVFVIFLFSCKQETKNDNLEKKSVVLNDSAREVNIESSEEVDHEIIVDTVLDIGKHFPGFSAKEKMDLNLDGDTYTEQLIILTDKNNEITIAIADFYVATKDYIVAWEFKLPIIYNDDFSINEQDILGIQQDLQLVISGTTSNKLNALFLFQKTAAPKGLHIYYKEIFSNITEGTIEVITKDRDLDYIEKQKNLGKAYDISIESSKMVNENTLSVTKEKWIWDRRKRQFIKDSSKIEEIKINVKEKLTAIYRGSKLEFLNFIAGEWYMTNDNEGISNILIFDPANNLVQYNYEDGFQVYEIDRISKQYRKLHLELIHSNISNLFTKISLTLENTDEITLAPTRTSSNWVGKYTRLRKDQKKSLISNINTTIKRPSPFTGVFKNVLYSLNFSYPDYKKIDNNGVIEEGIYTILELSNGISIIQMKSSDKSVQNYKLIYEEQKLESQIIRTIKIHEGTLTAYGIEISPDTEVIKFEQTEVISGE